MKRKYPRNKNVFIDLNPKQLEEKSTESYTAANSGSRGADEVAAISRR